MRRVQRLLPPSGRGRVLATGRFAICGGGRMAADSAAFVMFFCVCVFARRRRRRRRRPCARLFITFTHALFLPSISKHQKFILSALPHGVPVPLAGRGEEFRSRRRRRRRRCVVRMWSFLCTAHHQACAEKKAARNALIVLTQKPKEGYKGGERKCRGGRPRRAGRGAAIPLSLSRLAARGACRQKKQAGRAGGVGGAGGCEGFPMCSENPQTAAVPCCPPGIATTRDAQAP